MSGYTILVGNAPFDPKDSSRVGVAKCLDLLWCHSHGSPCCSCIQKDRFCNGAEVSDFDVDRLSEAQMFFIYSLPSLLR